MTVNISQLTGECNRHCDVTVTSHIFGNKCEHNPLKPRQFIAPASHKPRWDFLAKASRNLHHYYRNPTQWLYDLWINRYIDNDNHYHQMRSERREAMVSILQVILHYLDISTLEIKVVEEGSAFIPTVEWLANKAGVTLKRAYRCLNDLRYAKYLSFGERWKSYADGTKFKGLAAIKMVSKKLLIHLGISEKLLSARQKRKNNNVIRKEEPKALERMRINSPKLYETYMRVRGRHNRAPP